MVHNIPHTEEAKKKMSESTKAWYTEENRKKHAESMRNRKPFDHNQTKESRTKRSKTMYGFSWLERDFGTDKELQHFIGCHNRVGSGKSPSICWERNVNGFRGFMKEIGNRPINMVKPSVGRIDHSKGYEPGNIQWEEHSLNSIKRKGTRYAS